MRRTSLLLLVSTIVFANPLIASAEDPESTPDEFREFGKLLVGRWAGDITLIADWPGQEKKQGEEIVGYSTYSLIADGMGIEWESVAGTTAAKTLIVYDASTKNIKAFNVGTDGGHWQTVIWKKSDDEWAWKLVAGGLVDGRELRGEGSWIFENDGRTHRVQGDVTLAGEALPELNDKYTRVSD